MMTVEKSQNVCFKLNYYFMFVLNYIILLLFLILWINKVKMAKSAWFIIPLIVFYL